MGRFRCECDEYTFSDTVLPHKEYYGMFPSVMVWDTPENMNPQTEIEMWECPVCKGLTRFDQSGERTCYYKRVGEEKQ